MEVERGSSRPRIIALVGCTGSGKTGLGVALARVLETEVISVDSMAVYRGMDIGTAKPGLEDRQGIPHHLLDVVDPDEPFTAADFVQRVRPILLRLHAEGRVAVLVGGTGLYLRTLLHGMLEGPAADPALRESLLLEARAEEASGEPLALHRRLRGVDPVLAERLHPHDEVRILRALEVSLLTGRPLSAWQAEHRFSESPYPFLKLALELERDVLYRRIDARVERMVAQGLEAEVAGLLERYGPGGKPMKGLGYLHFVRRLTGDGSLEQTVAELQRDTRRFARRQLTWFRGERQVEWIPPDEQTLLCRARKWLETSRAIGY